jgi:hypothetical protein
LFLFAGPVAPSVPCAAAATVTPGVAGALRILFLGGRWGAIRAATVTAGAAVAFRVTGQVITQNPKEGFRLHRHQPSPVPSAVRHDRDFQH